MCEELLATFTNYLFGFENIMYWWLRFTMSTVIKSISLNSMTPQDALIMNMHFKYRTECVLKYLHIWYGANFAQLRMRTESL